MIVGWHVVYFKGSKCGDGTNYDAIADHITD